MHRLIPGLTRQLGFVTRDTSLAGAQSKYVNSFKNSYLRKGNGLATRTTEGGRR